jgi:hypothetical protein
MIVDFNIMQIEHNSEQISSSRTVANVTAVESTALIASF